MAPGPGEMLSGSAPYTHVIRCVIHSKRVQRTPLPPLRDSDGPLPEDRQGQGFSGFAKKQEDSPHVFQASGRVSESVVLSLGPLCRTLTVPRPLRPAVVYGSALASPTDLWPYKRGHRDSGVH